MATRVRVLAPHQRRVTLDRLREQRVLLDQILGPFVRSFPDGRMVHVQPPGFVEIPGADPQELALDQLLALAELALV